MKRIIFVLSLIAGTIPVSDVQARTAQEPIVRFQAIDLYVDSGEHRLVAYQVEMRFDKSRVEVVGVEGGEAEVFKGAPHYDPRGLAGGRLILAAFTTDHKNAPRGRTRVARSHLRIEGEGQPDLGIRLITAAEPGGQRIKAKVDLEPANSDTMTKEEKGGE